MKPIRNIFLAEDFTGAIQQQRDSETPGGVSPISESMFMGQKYGLGYILVCHSLSGLGTIVSRNIEAWIITRFQGEDPRLIRNLLGLTTGQIDQMRTLRPGEFVIFNPVIWPKPVLASFLPPNIPGVCDAVMQKTRVERFLSGVTAKPPASLDSFHPRTATSTASQHSESPRQGLPRTHLETLIMIARGVPKTATAVYSQMGLSRTQGSRIIKALETTSSVRGHRFSTGRVGGQICFFEVLEHGWRVLEQHGLSKPASITRGGFEHELAAHLLKAEAQANNLRIEFEIDLGSLRPDAVLIHKKTSERHYFNIGISNPEREVDSIQKFFALPVAQESKFTLIVRDSEFSRKVQKALKARKAPKSVVKQVNIRLIADLVKK